LAVFALHIPFYFFEIGGSRQSAMCLGVALVMAVLWVSETIPSHITALLPLVSFPLMGISPGSTLPMVFFKDSIVLCVTASMLAVAVAIKKTCLHRRFALHILQAAGNTPTNMCFGFFFATWFLGMWMRSTATVALMVPIALSTFGDLDEAVRQDPDVHRFRQGIIMGLACSANVGGIGTIIGTGTNLPFAEIFPTLFPEAPPISFGRWMLFGFPLALVLLFVV
jgi:sodium-dependent dicarboxylate transporter 2/3/5